jgi:phosphopantothenoylcysteine decarboxylase/phosphopantothenate--cysteine ligase
MADALLAGKRIILAVTGGIAAYKAADLCSKLVQRGADVAVILTEAATHFIEPLTFSALSGNPARVDLWSAADGEAIPHVQLASAAEGVVVAPLSANTLGKLALGLADNLLTATLLATPPDGDGSRPPWILAPAMEARMWENRTTQGHLRALLARGAVAVGPGAGRLASGATGTGRMAEPAEILDALRLALARGGPLAGKVVLVTAGGTQEPLDPVRYITNASSGKMGVALAEASRDLGALTVLVHAPLTVPLPYGVESVPVRTAQEMRDAVMSRVGGTDILIGAAAVADYRPAESAPTKIKKGEGGDGMTLRLLRNPDVLTEAAAARGVTGRPAVVVGFAAETDELLANAGAKLVRKKLDLIAANDVSAPGAGFGADVNGVILLFAGGRVEPLPVMPKREVADRILAEAARILIDGAPHAE